MLQIGGGILHHHHPADRVLEAHDVAGDDRERLLVIGDRQQVVEIRAAGDAPGDVVRDCGGIEAPHQRGDAPQVLRVQPLRRAQRQADAMQADRVVLAQRFQHRRRRAAAKEVLGMDLEPSDVRLLGAHALMVCGTQADAGGGRKMRGEGGQVSHRCRSRWRGSARDGWCRPR
jgi:hypothetical protein